MNRFRTVEATLNAELAKPYAYGTADCFFLGCAMIDALTGARTTEKYQGSYTTLVGAQKALRKRKHKSLVTFFVAELGQQPQAASSARMGDLVIIRLSDGAEHVGICIGTRFVTKTPTGRQYCGLSEVIAAFNIG